MFTVCEHKKNGNFPEKQNNLQEENTFDFEIRLACGKQRPLQNILFALN